MLSLFRRNLFVNYILLFVLTLALHLYFFFFINDFNQSINFEGILSKIQFLIEHPLLYLSLSISLICIEAIIISRLVVKHKLSRLLSTIPGAMFILITGIFIANQIDLHIILANFFLVLALSFLFNLYKKYLPIATIFNCGFFLALSVISYYPFIVFFPILLYGLYKLRSINIKEILQFFFGFILPFFFIWVIAYNNNSISETTSLLLQSHGLVNFSFTINNDLIKFSFLILSIVLALLSFNEVKKKKKFDAIKKVEINYWLLLAGLVSIFFNKDANIGHCMICAIPLAFILGLIFETSNLKIVKEFTFTIMLIGFFMIQFAAYIF